MKKGAIFDMDGTILDSMPTWRGFTKVIIELLGMEPDRGAEGSGRLLHRRLQKS